MNHHPQRIKGRWAPGVSGNPGGRPKEIGEVRELARQHTREAIETLVSIMLDPNAKEAARVRAAEALLDRGWGRPPQSVELTQNEGLRIVISERIARALDIGAGRIPGGRLPGCVTPGEDGGDGLRGGC